MPAGGAGDDAPAPRFSPALAVQKHPGPTLAVSLVAGAATVRGGSRSSRASARSTSSRSASAVDQDGTRLESDRRPDRRQGVPVRPDRRGRRPVDHLLRRRHGLASSTRRAGRSTSPASRSPPTWRRSTLAGGLRKSRPPAAASSTSACCSAGSASTGSRSTAATARSGHRTTVSTLLPVRRGQRADRRAAGLLRHRHRRRLRHQPRPGRADRPVAVRRLPAHQGARPGGPRRRPDDGAASSSAATSPPSAGTFWFAAGLSFNSFALVDGIAVVAVAGRRRLRDQPARPGPHGAARRSGGAGLDRARAGRAVLDQEGVVLVQAQLTDNSWLLYPDVRLTGGFAFASGSAGRTGASSCSPSAATTPTSTATATRWCRASGSSGGIGDLVSITGGLLRADLRGGDGRRRVSRSAPRSARPGPRWSSAPTASSTSTRSTYQVDGLRLDRRRHHDRHLVRRDHVLGPPARRRLTVDGPAVPRGGDVRGRPGVGDGRVRPEPAAPRRRSRGPSSCPSTSRRPRPASPGPSPRSRAPAPCRPPAGRAAAATESPDGQPDRPFRVVAEFTATVTSTIPITRLVTGSTTRTLSTSRTVSVAPMGEDGDATPTVTLRLRHRKLTGTGAGGPDATDLDQITALVSTPQADGAYPVGAWGEAQDLANPKVPAGDIITATDRVELVATAVDSREPARARRCRRPSPTGRWRSASDGSTRCCRASRPPPSTRSCGRRGAARHDRRGPGRGRCRSQRHRGGGPSAAHAGRAGRARGRRVAGRRWPRRSCSARSARASLRSGPPRPSTAVTPTAVEASAPREPRVLAVLSAASPAVLHAAAAEGGAARPRGGTTVSDELLRQLARPGACQRPAPGPGESGRRRCRPRPGAACPPRGGGSAARPLGRTVVAAGAPPVSGLGPVGAAAVAARAGSPSVLASLRRRTADLLAGQETVRRRPRSPSSSCPTRTRTPAPTSDHGSPVEAGRVRAVLLGASGRVLADTVLTRGRRVAIPVGARSVVVLGGPRCRRSPGPGGSAVAGPPAGRCRARRTGCSWRPVASSTCSGRCRTADLTRPGCRGRAPRSCSGPSAASPRRSPTPAGKASLGAVAVAMTRRRARTASPSASGGPARSATSWSRPTLGSRGRGGRARR